MDTSKLWETLVRDDGGKIVYLIMDGLGGIQDPKTGKTELQAANIPNLDRLAKESVCGVLDIVGPGITPGSGPGHLALFGYNPLTFSIGRGIFSALGIDFDLKKGDVAARVNFATMGKDGKIEDRRAGRIETSLNRSLCQKIMNGFSLENAECFLETESEYRAVLVLRGEGLEGNIEDTDPQRTGLKPLDPMPKNQESEMTADLLRQVIDHAKHALRDESPANMILVRGCDTYQPVSTLKERFHLDGLCLANYPMYRGVSRLLGMDVLPPLGSLENQVSTFKKHFSGKHNFFFIHVKKTDSAGEDGDFERKVKVIEEVDQMIPEILSVHPDVLVITGDHSTPAVMRTHSWHPVPVLIYAKTVRIDTVTQFDEISCVQGGIGRENAIHLMGLALAHARRLNKFGA